MALLFMDSFDWWRLPGPGYHTSYPQGRYEVATRDIVSSGGLGNAGRTTYWHPTLNTVGAALWFQFGTPQTEIITYPLPASGGFVVGFAFRENSSFIAGHGVDSILQIREGAVPHLGLKFDGAGHLQVTLGAAVLATSSLVLNNDWYYIEFAGVIHASAGSYELRIDTIPTLSASGITTRNGGATGQWDRVRLSASTDAQYHDDFYICDQSGAAPLNTFLGPVKIECMLPAADYMGTSIPAQWAPTYKEWGCTAADHGSSVNEQADTSNYIRSAVVNTRESFQVQTPVLAGAPLAVQACWNIGKNDPAVTVVTPFVRQAGVDASLPPIQPVGTYFHLRTTPMPVNPTTGLPWTLADLDAVELGVKVTT